MPIKKGNIEERISLTVNEVRLCEKISATRRGLDSKRAKALIAVSNGATNAEASKSSGLAHGQVRYLLTIFRDKRAGIFGDENSQRVRKTVKVKQLKEKAPEPEKKKKRDGKKKKKDKSGKKEKKEKKNRKKSKKGKKSKKSGKK